MSARNHPPGRTRRLQVSFPFIHSDARPREKEVTDRIPFIDEWDRHGKGQERHALERERDHAGEERHRYDKRPVLPARGASSKENAPPRDPPEGKEGQKIKHKEQGESQVVPTAGAGEQKTGGGKEIKPIPGEVSGRVSGKNKPEGKTGPEESSRPLFLHTPYDGPQNNAKGVFPVGRKREAGGSSPPGYPDGGGVVSKEQIADKAQSKMKADGAYAAGKFAAAFGDEIQKALDTKKGGMEKDLGQSAETSTKPGRSPIDNIQESPAPAETLSAAPDMFGSMDAFSIEGSPLPESQDPMNDTQARSGDFSMGAPQDAFNAAWEVLKDSPSFSQKTGECGIPEICQTPYQDVGSAAIGKSEFHVGPPVM
jgi:hypothetical protein